MITQPAIGSECPQHLGARDFDLYGKRASWGLWQSGGLSDCDGLSAFTAPSAMCIWRPWTEAPNDIDHHTLEHCKLDILEFLLFPSGSGFAWIAECSSRVDMNVA